MTVTSSSLQDTVDTLADHELLVVPHHFDRLRRPVDDPNTNARASFEQALTWNIFRTFELLPPPFWLRRLRARLQDTNPGMPAPTVARVSLWQALAPSPAQALTADATPVVADVLIETEFTVWALISLVGRDINHAQDGSPDMVARMIDAACWCAGARECSVGLIVSDPAHSPRAVSRVRHYARHRSHVVNVLAGYAEHVRKVGAIGVARWTDLAEILGDGAASDALTPVDRAIANRALEWINQWKASLSFNASEGMADSSAASNGHQPCVL